MADDKESPEGLVPGRDVILSEMEPLDELLKLIPKKAISGLMSYQQHLTSVTAKDEFVFVGTNLGVVYVLEKFCGILSKIHAENRKHEITYLAMQSSHDYLACGSNKGTLTIFKLRIRRDNFAELEKKQIESSHVANITCILWSGDGKRLFVGDSSGQVSVTMVDFEQRHLKSIALIHEDSGICQLDFLNNHLLISSKMKCLICNCDVKSKEITIEQVGSKPRKSPGDLGACLWSNDDQINIYACRPGLRLWNADMQGKVQTTLAFKDLIMKGMFPPIAFLGCFSIPTNGDLGEDLKFGLIRKFNDQYLCIWFSHYLWIIDPLKQSIVGGSTDIGNVIDVALTDTDIYLLRIGNEKPLVKISLAAAFSKIPRPHLVEEHHIVPAAIGYSREDNSSSVTEEHIPIGKKIASIFTHKSKEPSNETIVGSSIFIDAPLPQNMNTQLYQRNVSQPLSHDNIEEEVVRHTTRKKKKKHIKKKPIEIGDSEGHQDNNVVNIDDTVVTELKEDHEDTMKEYVPAITAVSVAPDLQPSSVVNPTLSTHVNKEVSVPPDLRPSSVVLSTLSTRITEELDNINKNLQIIETGVSDLLKEEERNVPPSDCKLNSVDIEDNETKLSDEAHSDISNTANIDDITSFDDNYKINKTEDHISADGTNETIAEMIYSDNHELANENDSPDLVKSTSTEMQSKESNKAKQMGLEVTTKEGESLEINNQPSNKLVTATNDVFDLSNRFKSDTLQPSVTLSVCNDSNAVENLSSIENALKAKESESDKRLTSDHNQDQTDNVKAINSPERKEISITTKPNKDSVNDNFVASSLIPSLADSWSEYPGPGGNYLEQTFAPMNHVAASNSLIWCCDRSERIYYMPTNATNRIWHRIDGNAIQIASTVSGNAVWCVNGRGKAAYRTGIVRPGVPIGTEWSFIKDEIDPITQLDVSDGNVWASTRKHLCLSRIGISDLHPGGVLWNKVPTSNGIVMVSCNNDVVWAIDRNDFILVRQNVTPTSPVGDSWSKLSNMKVNYINLKDLKRQIAWVIDCNGDILYRKGVTTENPFGENKWYQISFGSYQVNQEASLINTIISTFAKRKEAKTVQCTPGSGLCVLSHNNNMYIAHGKITGTYWGPSNLIGVAKSTRFKLISASSYSGDDGVIWAVQQSDEIFTIDGRNRLSYINTPISIKEICSSLEGVWAISKNGQLLVRKNITSQYRQGDEWSGVDLFQLDNIPMVSVSCGVFSVWAVDIKGCMWYRTGVSDSHASISTTPAWIPVDSHLPHNSHFIHVSTGPGDWMVWACDNKHNVYIRTGIRPEFPIGEAWETVQGASATALALSNRFAWAVCPDGSLLCRYGITPNNIAGDYWKKVPGIVKRISVTPLDELWGIDTNGILIRREIDILHHSMDNAVDADDSDWVCL